MEYEPILHKSYECPFCNNEFDEYGDTFEHMKTCQCNPEFKTCPTCQYGQLTIHYDTNFYKCNKLRLGSYSCTDYKLNR